MIFGLLGIIKASSNVTRKPPMNKLTNKLTLTLSQASGSVPPPRSRRTICRPRRLRSTPFPLPRRPRPPAAPAPPIRSAKPRRAAVRRAGATVITVDAGASRHLISPLIYGVAFASKEQLQALNATLNRSGGNGTTRYNWKLNASNHANDYFFESIGEASAVPGESADTFVAATKAGGAQPMLTVPMLGWVAKLGPNRDKAGRVLGQEVRPAAEDRPVHARRRQRAEARRQDRDHRQRTRTTPTPRPRPTSSAAGWST